VHYSQRSDGAISRRAARTRTALDYIALAFMMIGSAGAGSALAGEQLTWFRQGVPVSQLRDVLNELRSAEDYGLDPADYVTGVSAEDLRNIALRQLDHPSQVRIDARVSATLQHFLSDLRDGRVTALHDRAERSAAPPSGGLRSIPVPVEYQSANSCQSSPASLPLTIHCVE
jgi:hypothetical protein